MAMARCQRLLVAVQQGQVDTVAALLQDAECRADGLAGSAPTPPGGGVDLPFAVRTRDGAVQQVQILHDQNVHQDSSLHFACIGAHMEIAALLLKAGCSPNLRNVQGHTPLHYAVRANNGDLVRLLMQYGADPDITTANTRNTPLHRAAALGCGAAVDGILDASCSIAADATMLNDHGNTPSMEAATALEKHCRRFDAFAAAASAQMGDTTVAVRGGAEAQQAAQHDPPPPLLPPAAFPRRGSGGEAQLGPDAAAAADDDADGAAAAGAEAAGAGAGAVARPQRGYVYSRRRKRGAAGSASFQALCADPVALSARTAELRCIVARLAEAEEGVWRSVPEVRMRCISSTQALPVPIRLMSTDRTTGCCSVACSGPGRCLEAGVRVGAAADSSSRSSASCRLISSRW